MNERTEYAFVKPLIATINKDWPQQAHHYKTMEHKDYKGDVLDVGCGCCEFAIVSKLVNPDIKLSVMDENHFYIMLGAYLGAKCDIQMSSYIYKIEQEPFEENSFDTINMSHVLEHVEDLDKALQWIKKILRPEGTLFIAVPFGSDHDAPEHAHYFVHRDGIKTKSMFNGEQDCKNIIKVMTRNGFEGVVSVFHEHELDKRHYFPPNNAWDMMFIAKHAGEKKW